MLTERTFRWLEQSITAFKSRHDLSDTEMAELLAKLALSYNDSVKKELEFWNELKNQKEE